MAILEDPLKEVLKLDNYINGEWVSSDSDQLSDVVNPATGNTIARVPNSTRKEVNAAVQAAKDAFPDWRRTTPLARVRCLFRLKELLEENFEELSRVQTIEHGKTIDESRGETRRGIEMVEVATGIPSLMMGYNLEDIATGIDEYVIYQPLGVCCHIAPYNFPFMVPLWFAPFAVATGNTIVIKPSPKDPISQVKLAELVDEAGFPPGVWNLVHGHKDAVSVLLEHPDIEAVTFVGSTKVGRDIVYKKCGETGKRVIAQCSAKNYMVVMPDCNVGRTIPALMTSFFGNTGQRCLAGANLIIVGDNNFYHEFLDRVVDTTSRIRIGYGLDEATQMGPMQSIDGKDRVLGYIEKGIEEGASLRLDGRKFTVRGDYPDRCFLGPTILEGLTTDMNVAQEEIFGPLMSVIRAKDLNEAIEMANSSNLGNAHAIFTSSGKDAREFQYRVQSGNVGINIGIVAPMAFFPFGGMKDSFFGVLHGQGKDAIRFFTESKVVIQRWL
ncbi:CoA-acylating methylmalonate-semialdehyde dehydrogenase [Candidatus Bipolaricaulota bacterium]|nr:CoA-acylating methylmalonate-semialdehyde dehydrogenase [Candidatus Bipolaricaulota bacterium]